MATIAPMPTSNSNFGPLGGASGAPTSTAVMPEQMVMAPPPLLLPGQDPKKTKGMAVEPMPKLPPKGSLERMVLDAHAVDVRMLGEERARVLKEGSWVEKARLRKRNAFAWAVLKTAAGLLYSSVLNPAMMLTDPVGSTYGVFMYSVLWCILSAASVILLACEAVGLHKLVQHISKEYGDGFSLINWAYPRMFDQLDVVAAARERFVAEMPPMPKDLGARKTQIFDLDVCKTALLFSSLMYERKKEYVNRAQDFPAWAETLLLKSEENMRAVCARWGIGFASVGELTQSAGPFCACFYPANLDENWVCVVFKGTTPEDFSEWLVDTTFAHETAGDWLWGKCHQGFYTSLFPGSGNGTRVVAYERIAETTRRVAETIATNMHLSGGKKVQVWVAGHSLGAALASLCYSRFLKAQSDLGDKCELRDCYTFGCPRVGDSTFATGFEACMNEAHNQGRGMWRISNDQDFVATVPPGLGDARGYRKMPDESLLNYATIGGEMHLTPNREGLYYDFEPRWGIRAGREIKLVEKTSESPLFPVQSRSVLDPIRMMGIIGPVVYPFLQDHFTTNYWSSLAKVQAPTDDSRSSSSTGTPSSPVMSMGGGGTRGSGGPSRLPDLPFSSSTAGSGAGAGKA